ncbi:K(+)-transporting ATPase subunit C [Streptomyces rimosus]|uniref:K(+)-transporting ATPase subunit C n=1 Tax=Streptomyces rimosus TaxID=1927 RepID=UPI0037986A61
MKHHHLPALLRRHVTALRMLLVFTVVTGIVYPLAVTGIAQAAFSDRANGSLLKGHGTPVASNLLGQRFDLPKKHPNDPKEEPHPDPKWFQPRPSAADAGAGAYDPTNSSASNLGPTSTKLLKVITERRAAVAAFNGVKPQDVPVDAVTASGSGLDPDISPAYARQQVHRIAQARHLPADRIRALVEQHVRGRDLGFLGQQRVNVIELNDALRMLH